MLTILPPWKVNDGSVTLFVQTMTCLDAFPPLCQHQYAEAPYRLSLSSIDEGNPTTSTHSRREYWAFFQHCLSIDDICLDKILFTFLITETSDSSFWKFSFKRLISAVSEAIVVLICSWVLRDKSIIWFLFNALSVSSVYIPATTSTRLLQWQKIAVK